ncbi:MAG: YtxH domain-containing protein [Candidatus Angelobacter sp.]
MNEYQRYGDYSEQMEEGTHGSGVGAKIGFLMVGMGLGAAVAALFTPRSGHELRDVIGRKCRNTVDNVSARTRDLRERGSNLLGFTRGSEEREYREG